MALPPAAFDLADDGVRFRAVAARIDHDGGTAVSERERDGAADIASGAGNDGDFAREFLCHAYTPQRREIDAAIIQGRHQLQCRVGLRPAPAAVLGIEQELVDDILPRQRLLRTTAQMRLAFLDHAAVPERRADMAGVVVRIGILGIDDEFHLGREREHTRIAKSRFRVKAPSPTPPWTKPAASR